MRLRVAPHCQCDATPGQFVFRVNFPGDGVRGFAAYDERKESLVILEHRHAVVPLHRALDLYSTVPIGTQDHFTDTKAGLVIVVIHAHRNFVLPDSKTDFLGKRQNIFGRLTNDNVHNFVAAQRVLVADLGRLRSRVARQRAQDASIGQALSHAHSYDRAMIVYPNVFASGNGGEKQDAGNPKQETRVSHALRIGNFCIGMSAAITLRLLR